MCENGGGAKAAEGERIARSDLIDELVLRFDRATGMLEIGGRVASDDVALMILERAVNVYTARTRAAYMLAAREQALEQERVRQLVNQQRGGRA